MNVPKSIRVSLIAFLLAFLFEAVIEVALLASGILPLFGSAAVLLSLALNPLALYWAMSERRRGYELLKWVATFGLAWLVLGKPYLHALGLWALTLVTVSTWARVIAVLLMQRKLSKAWIDIHTY